MSIYRENLKIALQLTGLSFTTGLEETFYFSNSGFIAAIAGDTEERYYQPLIKDSILLKHDISQTSDGINVRLINNDQNYLSDYLFHDYSLKIYIQADFSPASTAWYPFFIGECDSLTVKRFTVDIKAKSHFEVLTKSLNPAVFTGVSTSFEGEVEATDKTKPRLFGDVFNISPILLKANTLVYGCNWDYAGNRAAVTTISAVKDGGVALTLDVAGGVGGDFTTTALMDAYAPPAGQYVTCLAEGTIKLGSTPTFSVTMDVIEATQTVTQFANLLATELALSGTTVHFDPGYIFGFYYTSSTTYVSMFNALLKDRDLAYWFDSASILNIDTVRGYDANPAVVRFLDAGQEFIDDDDIIAFKVDRAKYELPPEKVNLKYQKNYTIQNEGDLAGSVPVRTREYLKADALKASLVMGCNPSYYKDIETVELESGIRNLVDATTEVAAWMAHRAQINDIFEVTCPILAANSSIILGVMTTSCTPVNIASTSILISSTSYLISNNNSACSQYGALTLGDTVVLNSDHFDINDDKFVVIGVNIDTKKMMVTYKLYGLRPISDCP